MNELIKLFNAGGLVMYPLLFISILIIALAVERLHFWSKIGNRQKQLIQTILDLYRNQSTLAIDRLKRERDLPIARIFMAAISLKDPTPEAFKLAIENEAHAEIPIPDAPRL